MVNHARLAAASQLTTPGGPILAELLQPGMNVWGVSNSGQLAPIKIRALRRLQGVAPLVRALTRAGDLLAPAESYIATSNGPVSVSKLKPEKRILEVAHPGDIPLAEGAAPTFKELSGYVAVIPKDVANCVALSAQLLGAGLQHEISCASGWVAVKVGCAGEPSGMWGWENELSLLSALTAWVPDGADPVCRTRLGDRFLRSRLIGAAVACGRQFRTSWVPGYLPVEAHMNFSAAKSSPYADITAVQITSGAVVDVSFDGVATATIVDLAYLQLKRI
jgi:hypothetical protein